MHSKRHASSHPALTLKTPVYRLPVMTRRFGFLSLGRRFIPANVVHGAQETSLTCHMFCILFLYTMYLIRSPFSAQPNRTIAYCSHQPSLPSNATCCFSLECGDYGSIPDCLKKKQQGSYLRRCGAPKYFAVGTGHAHRQQLAQRVCNPVIPEYTLHRSKHVKAFVIESGHCTPAYESFLSFIYITDF